MRYGRRPSLGVRDLLFVSRSRSCELITLLDLESPLDEVFAAGTVRLVPLEGMLHDLLRALLLSLHHHAFAITMVSVVAPIAVLMESTAAEVLTDRTATREGSGTMLLQRLDNLNYSQRLNSQQG